MKKLYTFTEDELDKFCSLVRHDDMIKYPEPISVPETPEEMYNTLQPIYNRYKDSKVTPIGEIVNYVFRMFLKKSDL